MSQSQALFINQLAGDVAMSIAKQELTISTILYEFTQHCLPCGVTLQRTGSCQHPRKYSELWKFVVLTGSAGLNFLPNPLGFIRFLALHEGSSDLNE